MARRYGNFLKGILGSLKLSVRAGQQIVSITPGSGTVNQTIATQQAGKTFGMASSLNSYIRQFFKPWLLDFPNTDMHFRLNRIMINVLNACRDPDSRLFSFEEQSFDGLSGFDFNMKSPLIKSLGMSPQISFADHMLSVSIPLSGKVPKLKFPKSSTTCEISLCPVYFLLKEGMKTRRSPVQHVVIEKIKPDWSGFDFIFEIPPGCFCVVGIFLHYYSRTMNHQLITNTGNLNPGGICSAIFNKGKYQGNDGLLWENMFDLQFEQD